MGGVLSDQQIKERINDGDLYLDPLLDEGQIEGAKIDLRLDNDFLLLRAEQAPHWDPLGRPVDRPEQSQAVNSYQKITVPFDKGFRLHPGDFALGQTLEVVGIPPDCFGRFDGRSTYARRGILVHVTAGGIDPGFVGPICLELYNVGHIPVRLPPLGRIGALSLYLIDGEVENQYEGKFGSSLHDTDMSKSDSDARSVIDASKRLSGGRYDQG